MRHIRQASLSKYSEAWIGQRRQWLRLAGGLGAGVSLVGSSSGWLQALAETAATDAKRKRSCILLWMNGGPSQMDTFDLKPGTTNGGEFTEIETSVPGIRISQHLPQLAKQAQHLTIVRSMATKEGDHTRATYFVRNGYLPQGPIRYPTLGALVAKHLGEAEHELPGYVSIAPYRVFSPAAYSSGFLGSQFDPLLVGDASMAPPQEGGEGPPPDDYELKVADLSPPANVSGAKVDARLGLLEGLNSRFLSNYHTAAAVGHRVAYERAVRLMRSAAGKAFDLEEEPAKVRDRYGRNRFGQGCLLARRLVERHVPFVEVTLGGIVNGQALGWDTHTENFTGVRNLSEVLDPAWATLLAELDERGLLDSTLVVWAGEFGRTPNINNNGGRDHFPQAWSTVLCGGGIRGGQVVGKTSDDGMKIEDRPVTVPDLLATVCRAIGVDPDDQNVSNIGRPIKVVDAQAKPLTEILV